MNDDLRFLGTGWTFPPEFTMASGVKMLSGVDDINSSLHILLSTTVGERVMQPEYGCNLRAFLFDPLNMSMLAYIKKLIGDAILYFEPRIRLENIQLNTSDGWLEITVDYIIKATNSRTNYVYPFYLNEGNEVK